VFALSQFSASRRNGRSQLRYAPWGKQRYAQHTTPTGYRYTAQRWDSGLGLYDYNARYYDPHIGRFISADTLVPDPASPQAFNRYAYVRNSPLNRSDPTGHMDSAFDLGGGGVENDLFDLSEQIVSDSTGSQSLLKKVESTVIANLMASW